MMFKIFNKKIPPQEETETGVTVEEESSWFSSLADRFKKDRHESRVVVNDSSSDDEEHDGEGDLVNDDNKMTWFQNLKEKIGNDKKQEANGNPHQELYDIDKAHESPSWFSSLSDRFQKDQTLPAPPNTNVSDPEIPDKNVSLLDLLKNRFDKNDDRIPVTENRLLSNDVTDDSSSKETGINWFANIKGKFRKEPDSDHSVAAGMDENSAFTSVNAIMVRSDKPGDDIAIGSSTMLSNEYQSNGTKQADMMNKRSSHCITDYDEPGVLLTDNDNTAVGSRVLHDIHTSSYSLSSNERDEEEDAQNNTPLLGGGGVGVVNGGAVTQDRRRDSQTPQQADIENSNRTQGAAADIELRQNADDSGRNWINRFKQQFAVTGKDTSEARQDNVSHHWEQQAEKQADISWFANIKQQLTPGNNEKKANNKDSAAFLSGFKRIFNKKDEKDNKQSEEHSIETLADNTELHCARERDKYGDIQTSSDESEPDENDKLLSDHYVSPQNNKTSDTNIYTNDTFKTDIDFKMQRRNTDEIQQSSSFSNADKNQPGDSGYNPFNSDNSDSECGDSMSQADDRPLTLLDMAKGKSKVPKHTTKKKEPTPLQPKLPTQVSVDSSTANTISDSDDREDVQALFKRVSKSKPKSKPSQRTVLSDEDDEEIDDMEIFNDVSIRQIRESMNRELSQDSSNRTGSLKSNRTGSIKSGPDTESEFLKSAHEENSITKSIKKRWKKIVKKQKSITKKHKNKKLARDTSVGTCSNASDSENMTGTSIDIDSGVDGNGWASEYKHNADHNKSRHYNDENKAENQSDRNKKVESKPPVKLKDMCATKSVDSVSDSILSNLDSGDDVKMIRTENQDKISKTQKMAHNNNIYNNPSFINNETMESDSSRTVENNSPKRKMSSFDDISLDTDKYDSNAAVESPGSKEKQDSVEKEDSDRIVTSSSSDFDKQSDKRSDVRNEKTDIDNSGNASKETTKAEVGWFQNLKQKLNIDKDPPPPPPPPPAQKTNEATSSVEEQNIETHTKESGFFESLKERFTTDAKPETQNKDGTTSHDVKDGDDDDDDDDAETEKEKRSESPSWFDNLKQKMNIGNDSKDADNTGNKPNVENEQKDANPDASWFENFKHRMFNDDEDKDKKSGDKAGEGEQETHVIKISRHSRSSSESGHDSDDSVFLHSANEKRRKAAPVQSVTTKHKKVETPKEKASDGKVDREHKIVENNHQTHPEKEKMSSVRIVPKHQIEESSKDTSVIKGQNESDSEFASSVTVSSRENKPVTKLAVNGPKKNKTKRRNSSRNDLYSNSQNEDISDTGSSDREDMRIRSNGSSERRKRITHNHPQPRIKQITNKRVSPLGQPPEKPPPSLPPQKEPAIRRKNAAPPPVVISVKDKNRPTNFDPLSYKGGTGRKLPQIPKKPSNLAYTPPDPDPMENIANEERRHRPHRQYNRRIYPDHNRLSVEDAERVGRSRNFASSKHHWDEIDSGDKKRGKLPEQHSSESEWTAMGHDRPSVSGSSTACMEYSSNINPTSGNMSDYPKRGFRGSDSCDIKYTDVRTTSPTVQPQPEKSHVNPAGGAYSDPYSRRRVQTKRGASRDEWEDYRRGINIPFHWNCCSACQSD